MKKLGKYKYIVLLMMVYVVVYFAFSDAWRKIVKMDYGDFLDAALLFPAVFLLLGLIEVWVNKETMTKLLGENSGIKGSMIAYLLGMLGVGALYVAFPVSIVLLKKGASMKNVYIFLGAWSTTKITQILVEVRAMGIKYTVLRFILNIVGIVFVAKMMGVCVKDSDVCTTIFEKKLD